MHMHMCMHMHMFMCMCMLHAAEDAHAHAHAHALLHGALQVLGNIKVVLLIGVSVAIFRNEVSPQSVVGCAACLVGVALYNRARRSSPSRLPLKSTAAAEGTASTWV